MDQLQAPRGTHDYLGEDSRKFTQILNTFSHLAEQWGFEPVSTPILEFTAVYSRSLGNETDIVNKEMYTFSDRGNENITLRPEGTAGIARAFVSNGWSQNAPLKLFYSGPMFRYERPQKGRLRQFHQVGVEIIGSSSPYSDADTILFAHHFLSELQVPVTLELNSIGDASSRKNFSKALCEYLGRYAENLSPDSQRRLKTNPLRILDSKSPEDQKILESAPHFSDHLSEESKTIWEEILELLDHGGVSYTINPKLVRGLDYYSHCVFEFKSSQLGAQDAVLAGGRYNDLISQLGGPPTPAVGWASGVERLSLILGLKPQDVEKVAVIPVSEANSKEAYELCCTLRREGVPTDFFYSGNLSKQMKKADRAGARLALVLGEEEIKANQVLLKDLKKGTQEKIECSHLVPHIRSLLIGL